VDAAVVVQAALDTSDRRRREEIALVVIDPQSILTGDPERLQQIVWNLLSNGVKFGTPASVDVAVRTRLADRDPVRMTASHSPDFLPQCSSASGSG